MYFFQLPKNGLTILNNKVSIYKHNKREKLNYKKVMKD